MTRLQTAILHIQGTLGNNLQFIQKNVYENYKMYAIYFVFETISKPFVEGTGIANWVVDLIFRNTLANLLLLA